MLTKASFISTTINSSLTVRSTTLNGSLTVRYTKLDSTIKAMINNYRVLKG
jgi:hypothetical protein